MAHGDYNHNARKPEPLSLCAAGNIPDTVGLVTRPWANLFSGAYDMLVVVRGTAEQEDHYDGRDWTVLVQSDYYTTH